MLTVAEVAAAIEEIAPAVLAREWDNVGTLVDCGGEVSAILVCLDVTDEVLDEADALGCNLIVSHHPVIFHPLRSVACGSMPYRLVRKNISVISAHTNLDTAPGGVNDVLAAIFGLKSTKPFAGCGRVGALEGYTTAAALAARCAEKLGAHVRLADCGRPVHTLAVLGGSGGGLVGEALAEGADCILTGEASHHDALDALQAGISLIVSGHFHTEYPVVGVLAGWLSKRFPEVNTYSSRRNRDPFTYVNP